MQMPLGCSREAEANLPKCFNLIYKSNIRASQYSVGHQPVSLFNSATQKPVFSATRFSSCIPLSLWLHVLFAI